jgi:hypothetical protein
MADWFTVTTASSSVDLDRNRRGSASFSVTNVSGAPLRGRALPFADAPAQAAWFTVADGAERSFPAGGTERYEVDVAAPATAAPGGYRFRLDVLGTDNPDEVQAHGQWVSFQVPVPPKPQPRRIPWLWIAIAAAVLVVLVAGGVTAFVLTHRQGTLSPSVSTVGFGTVAVGGAAATPVTVRNTGPGATAVTATIGGPNAKQFAIADDGCRRAGRLQPNASCVVQVRFAPAAAGTAVGVLQLGADNAAARSVSLTGTGGVPTVSAPPFQLVIVSFDPLLGPNTRGTATVTNTGTVDLHVRSVTVQGAMHVTADTCTGRAVAPRQSCTITIANIPGIGLVPGALVITSDAPGPPTTVPFG